jgi:uncharacterized protein
MTDDRLLARVVGVQSFPVKSVAADPIHSLLLDEDGVVGDRRYAVVDASGSVLTVESAPRLRDVRAALDEGRLTLRFPGAANPLQGSDAEAALTAVVGRAVRLVAVEPGSQLDAPVHLVSVQSVDAARRGEHADADCACSVEEPRANLVLDLVAGDEREWVDRRIRVGESVLAVRRRPGHCLGVYAEVTVPGRIEVGDVVLAEDGQDAETQA